MPELTASVIPPGTYPSLNRAYATVGLFNFAVAHKDLPLDLVYRIVDAVFDNHEEMLEIPPRAAATIPATSSTTASYRTTTAHPLYGNTLPAGVLTAD
jgi:TRAP-type uncharacterized transport system substrate-binding protein